MAPAALMTVSMQARSRSTVRPAAAAAAKSRPVSGRGPSGSGRMRPSKPSTRPVRRSTIGWNTGTQHAAGDDLGDGVGSGIGQLVREQVALGLEELHRAAIVALGPVKGGVRLAVDHVALASEAGHTGDAGRERAGPAARWVGACRSAAIRLADRDGLLHIGGRAGSWRTRRRQSGTGRSSCRAESRMTARHRDAASRRRRRGRRGRWSS